MKNLLIDILMLEIKSLPLENYDFEQSNNSTNWNFQTTWQSEKPWK